MRVVALLCDAVCLASFPCGVLGVLKLVDGTDRGLRWLCVLNASSHNRVRCHARSLCP